FGEVVLDPAGDLAHYLHPASRASMQQFLELSLTGWTEEDSVRAVASMDIVFELVRRMDAAGIRLGIGTDGNGGGPHYERELQLHLEAGLTPWRVLQLATQGGAELIGIDDETGRLAAGYEADIVFLGGNPLENMRHARDVAWVVTDGAAHRFSDLTADVHDQ
ncbi:MAG: amidohydrolase family protein, partial [Pseudomonadota bacterium]